ncbi:hypothetical protein [Novosphingobium sp. Leaf2]|uniref:hypothetical protein n=1 Tax=Novosphingobium sp. Leaf2 TaxID=1735670 RepID=UPI0006FC593D|nr:hypothetical protein [Novosphingobium sp. Leaf2]KQM21926.1 hypothetical protein ASE49_01020 [Novosphingobium sp. Leaf2]
MTRQGNVIVLERDHELDSLQRRVALLAGFYQRRLLPTLTGAAVMLGTVVIVAQLAKWIAP